MFLEAEPVLLDPPDNHTPCAEQKIDFSKSLHNWYSQINLACASPL